MKNIFPLISLGNEQPVIKDYSLLVPGSVCLANEARLTTATFSEALTAYAAGWSDKENLQETVNFIAPRTPVGRRFEYKKAKNAEAFLSEVDDERVIGADFKRVEYRGDTVNSKTKNRGLTIRLDRDEMSGLMDEERATALLLQRIKRNKLRRAITVILAAATDTPVNWGNAGTPDEDMREAVAAAQLSSGVYPNRGLIGLVAWNLRAQIYSAQDTAGAFAAMNNTPDQVGQKLGLEGFRSLASLYQSSPTAKTRILASLAVFFYAQDMMSKDDPSVVKEFVSSVDGGGDTRVHREEIGPKFLDITVEHYDSIEGTAGTGVGATKLTITDTTS